MEKLFVLAAAAVLSACTSEETLPSGITLDPSGHETAASYLACFDGRAALVSAHRGGPAPGYPENAVETFLRTLAQVPALIETDVRETRDGVLVLMHDETVDRTTNGAGRVDELTLAEIKALRLRDETGALTAFQVPTLQEALAAMRERTVLQLDVKRGVGLSKVARAVKAAGAQAHAAIITYSGNGAVIAASQGENLTVIANAASLAEVEGLQQRGVPEGRLVVWTGVIERPDAGFLAQLGERGIPASGGTLGALDDRAATGGAGVYASLERAGLDIVATDRPVAAARDLGIKEVGEAAEACISGG